MSKPGEKYIPPNGIDGCTFIEDYCANCVHEKWLHDQDNPGAKQCPILSKTILEWPDEKNWPEEWTFNAVGIPVCTAWVKWDWGHDDNGDLIDPPPPEPVAGPNQLCFPFEIEFIERNTLVEAAMKICSISPPQGQT